MGVGWVGVVCVFRSSGERISSLPASLSFPLCHEMEKPTANSIHASLVCPLLPTGKKVSFEQFGNQTHDCSASALL